MASRPKGDSRKRAAAPAKRKAPTKRKKRKYAGTVREKQKQDTLARVLDSALTHFAGRGFEAASTREIAAGAGVTHAVIRLHFGSKEKLWRAAVDHLFTRMALEMAPGPGEPLLQEGRAGLESFARRYVRYCARHPEHARLMLQESMHKNGLLDYAVKKHIAPSHHFMHDAVKTAVAGGVLHKVSPISFIYIMSAASQAVFALSEEARAIYGVDVFEPDFVEKHADAVVRMLMRD
jgi:AcrR family transcriptional regulator